MDTPLCVVVSELFVLVVEGFGGEELAGLWRNIIWECLVILKREVDAIQSEAHLDFLDK